ncbi:MAG TPA: hypothetical protein IAB06_07985 [Candidatus Avacidaminococcus intestinavium]|uniref:Uncharacterized protein n=1 Tax=Candidatus Avacidaminococcus intestinavium TaxID=2840684 RepID=A0A9D1SLL0_9FIRM|nr:hypothetical protein [Candidatus Avacidaminococcus intestinavium]
MINYSFATREENTRQLKLVQVVEEVTGHSPHVVDFIFPSFDESVLTKILRENLDGTEWKFETGGDEAVTALFMLAPDDNLWGATRNTLIYLSLAGERSLLEVLEDVTSTDSQFTAEEYALCIWAKQILSVLATLKKQGLNEQEILKAADLKALFN